MKKIFNEKYDPQKDSLINYIVEEDTDYLGNARTQNTYLPDSASNAAVEAACYSNKVKLPLERASSGAPVHRDKQVVEKVNAENPWTFIAVALRYLGIEARFNKASVGAVVLGWILLYILFKFWL